MNACCGIETMIAGTTRMVAAHDCQGNIACIAEPFRDHHNRLHAVCTWLYAAATCSEHHIEMPCPLRFQPRLPAIKDSAGNRSGTIDLLPRGSAACLLMPASDQAAGGLTVPMSVGSYTFATAKTTRSTG